MATKNFKSGAAYKNYLGYIHANDLDKPGGADVTIKGKKHKVDRSAAKQESRYGRRHDRLGKRAKELDEKSMDPNKPVSKEKFNKLQDKREKTVEKRKKIRNKKDMKTNQAGGDASTTEAANQLKELESIAKQSKSPAKKVNSWEEEDVKRGREQQKEGHTGHADALFDDAHDSHNWHGGNYGHESFAKQFNDKSPMKRFQDFDQMDTRNAKATAGESPTMQGKTISDGGNKKTLFGSENFYKKNYAHDQAWELHDDSAKAGFLPVTPKFDDYGPGSQKYNEVKKKISDKEEDKRKTAFHTRGIAQQHKSPVYKDGSMAGDQSATRSDYANFKDTDPGYHGHDGSSHGDQSATRSDYRSRMTRNSK